MSHPLVKNPRSPGDNRAIGFMPPAPSKPGASRGGDAFTLVELLVVVTIIAMLLAMLLPAMNKAIYAGRLAVCLSHARQHGLAAINIAGDNFGLFPSHVDRGPDYYRSRGASNSLWYRLTTGRYLTDGKVTLCPIITAGWATSSHVNDAVRYVNIGPSGVIHGYGGWESNAAQISTVYMWTANYTPTGGGSVIYLNNEPHWPRKVSDANPRATLITHRISDGGSPGYNVHDLGHRGRGFRVNSVLPIEAEQPLIFYDLSGIIRPPDDIYARVNITKNDFGYAYY